MEPADFYTGLVAELYAPLKGRNEAPDRYVRFVREAGEPSLELGCGDGEPLLDLRALGLDVEGVDSSADMLARCRELAALRGVEVVLHHQRMEALDLGRAFRSIFLAGPTFTLLPDDDTARAALRALRAHLTEDGTALIPLFVPDPTPAQEIGTFRETTRADGAILRVGVVAEEWDDAARTRRTTLRYERVLGGVTTSAERVWTLHWYPRPVFEEMVTAAGLTTVAVLDDDGRPAGPDASDVRYVLRVGP